MNSRTCRMAGDPEMDFCGEDSFDFKIVGECEDSDPATVTVQVGKNREKCANGGDGGHWEMSCAKFLSLLAIVSFQT